MKESIRFIHAADLHLGSPLKSLGLAFPELQKQLREATFTALRHIVDAALRHEVDFVLLAGDLYDLESRSIRANRILAGEMERLNAGDIRVFMIAGNHDPLGEINSEAFPLPENVTLFGSEEAQVGEVHREDQLVARIVGQSYRDTSDSRTMVRYYTVPDSAVWNIGLLHSALDPEQSNYVPCSVEDLKSKSDIHYWALGHIHQTRIVSENDPVIAYPGIPQGRDVGEEGVRGCLLVELAPEETPNLSLIPCSTILWQNCEVSIETGEEQQPVNIKDVVDLIEAVSERLSAYSPRSEDAVTSPAEDAVSDILEGTVVRWRLTGRGPVHERLAEDTEEASEEIANLLRDRLGRKEPFLWTESVQIQTAKPVASLEELAEEEELFSDIRSIIDDLTEDPELRKRLLDVVGGIWDTDPDYEEYDPQRFDMNERTLHELISVAKDRVVETIVERREDL